MPSLVTNCPHCDTKSAGFTYMSEFVVPQKQVTYAVTACCNVCGMPICVVLYNPPAHRDGRKPSDFTGNLMSSGGRFEVVAMYPSSVLDDSPSDIPENVRNAFLQASGSRRAQHFDAACGMYRRAMELALKAFSPDIEAWKIEKRIDRMAAENKITSELKIWAHELRLDGNDALHGDDEATSEMAAQMHELCKFLLIYLYTLPAQVEEARVRRAANE